MIALLYPVAGGRFAGEFPENLDIGLAAEAEITVLRDDQVIQHLYSQQQPRLDQTRRQVEVLLAGVTSPEG